MKKTLNISNTNNNNNLENKIKKEEDQKNMFNTIFNLFYIKKGL